MSKGMRIVTYILAFLVGSAVSAVMIMQFWNSGQDGSDMQKLSQIQTLLEERFVEEVDPVKLQDAAAGAMVDAAGDRWSHYISAADYTSYLERAANAYVGIGITIQLQEETGAMEIIEVLDGGPAKQAGLQVHDVVIQVEGKQCAELGLDGTKALVRGEAGTDVHVTVLRDEQQIEFTVTRQRFETPVATGTLLENGYGLITIENFESRCAEETIAAIDSLISQNAKGLIFDVRFNPGGYKSELVKVLDYLLPEGPLFRSQGSNGSEDVDYSDASCIDLPMAVLVNGDSYSAAEFFAAALQEYGAGTVVGQQTCGKGYYQNTFQLADGSAVAISTGKYFTPNGISLAGVGITPDVPVEVDQETYAAIYYDNLEPEEDPQLQAAIQALISAEQP